MKILDRYLLKTFLTTFASVFVILFFIFILQAVWLFIGELAGKDLDFFMIVKFLTFYFPSIVPMVLPLTILLASIMTFGDLSEHYEFAAMKSSGVSLMRALRSLTVFIFILSIAAFIFANNIIPYSQYKFINFKANIAQLKPAMAIAEGQFSDVGSYIIKVDKKSGPNGNNLSGITIHKKSVNGQGSTTIIKAKSGELKSSPDSKVIQLVLYNGAQFEDIIPKKYNEREKMPFAKTQFKKYNLNMDLSKLNKVDPNEEKVTSTSNMLKLSELTYTLDSLNKDYKKEVNSFTENIHVRTGIINMKAEKDSSNTTVPENLLDAYPPQKKLKFIDIAKSNVGSTTFTIAGTKDEFDMKEKNINSHWLSIYDKFVIAFACILMFFIGAPLGAIIRKGGLGLPIVFAILIFITFHFVNTFGKKLGQENGITPFLGAWMSSIILSPLAILLTYRAKNDLQMTINLDWLTDPFVKMFSRNKIRPSFEAEDRIINLDTISFTEDEEWRDLLKMSDASLIDTVYDSAKLGYSKLRRIKALKILDSRNITQADLIQQGKLFNEKYERLADANENYILNSKMTFITFLMTVVMVFVVLNNSKNVKLMILGVLVLICFYIAAFKTGQRHQEINNLLHRKVGIHPWLVMVLGFPFYIIFHVYNRVALRKAISGSSL
ncbi:LptF/LptG family permease [Flavobacterium pallidum]|uniref:Permease n=1 Tax=Flavobacterium pallidum TaxID=2172098 RepID=A0A2S1SJ10_9FLAO|nr:LptF/LptG family permease [Flavobacterium pallidum]AWI26337.1 permease [Flavobacterium pallidum]